jgi:hypothetical protein
MDFLKVAVKSKEDVINSFGKIANKLFNNYVLQVNDNYYRLIDIEFYYHSKNNSHQDIYTHKSDSQLRQGKWYFHDSGIDITIGNGEDHGGILIRAIAKLGGNATIGTNFFQEEIHGPLNVKNEILRQLNGPFDIKANIFQLNDISQHDMKAMMIAPSLISTSKRIGLFPKSEDQKAEFINSDYRYLMFWDNHNLKYKNKEAIVKALLSANKIEHYFAKKILGYNVTVL